MKNIIKIDITTYIIILLYLLSGNFKSIIILYSIIIFHEFGHIFFLKKFNKDIISINIYPFGGITKYNSLVNHNILEELLIAISGVLNQVILYLIFYILFKFNLINIYSYNLFIKYNTYLIIFNLLPLIGLDGEKIIHLLLEYIFPYKLTNNIVIIVSLITLVIFIYNTIKLKVNILFILTFIIYKLILFIKNKKYLENKFLLERYLYDIPYRKIKYIKGIKINRMYQETYHFFNNIKEYNYLNKRYNNIEKK